MRELLSALGAFEVVDKPEPPAADPLEWEAPYWRPYPLPKDYDFETKSWTRPAQLAMSFVGADVIDVEKSVVLPNRTVKIKAGLIESIEKTKETDIQEGGWTTVDARGLFMCPGLIDCHVHILEHSDDEGWGSSDVGTGFIVAHNLKGESSWRGPGLLTIRVPAFHPELVPASVHLPKLPAHSILGILSNGFTTVRDVGGANRYYRDATAEWLIPGPRLFIGGPVLSQTGGHGDHSRRNVMPSNNVVDDGQMGQVAWLVDGVDACLKTARKLMMAGADHIKICSSGGVLSPTDKLESSQFNVAEIRAICDTVKAMGGTLVTSHCFTSQGARNAIEGGIGGIEHGSLIDKPTLQLMAEKGVHLTPTLIIQELIVSGPLGRTVPRFSLEKARVVAAATYDTIKTAHEVGVNIAYGTDCPFEVQLAEFELRKKVLDSKDILKHATCNAAKVVGQTDKLGCLKPGAYADLLLLAKNPLEDVAILNRPKENLRAVIKDGRCVVSRVEGLAVEVSLK